jgi:hypothetical protein
VVARSGIASATVESPGRKAVVVQAEIPGEQARLELLFDEKPSPTQKEMRARFSGPLWEVGAALAPRVSGTFAGVALQGEARLQLRGTRVYLGLEVGGVYANAESVSGVAVRLGGAELRLAIEGRLRVKAPLWLGLAAEAGGTLVGERRKGSGTRSTSAFDGGPTVGAIATLGAKLGPGLLTFSAGFFYSPLLGLDATNVDGGVFTVGYRAARF